MPIDLFICFFIYFNSFFVIEMARKKFSNVWKRVSFKYFWLFESFFQKRFNNFFGYIKVCPILQLHEMMRVSHVVIFLFCFVIGVASEECSNLWNMIISKNFRACHTAFPYGRESMFYYLRAQFLSSSGIEISWEEWSNLRKKVSSKYL